MSAKAKVFTALDRPQLHWAIGPAATVFVSLANRRPCIVHAEGPLWIHRYPDAILPQPAVGGDDPGGREAKARDDFLFDYEPRMGDTIVDVGAGIGGETLTFSRLVGSEGRVVSIEGHPATAHALRRLVELNDLTNVTVLQVAVGREPGLVFMSNDTEDHLANSIRGDVLTDPPVPLLRLDDIVTDLGLDHIDFLKMNIEGAELDALSGMTDSLAVVRHAAVSCHDFLADDGADESVRTKAGVEEILTATGFTVVHRTDQRPWLADTLYATNSPASI